MVRRRIAQGLTVLVIATLAAGTAPAQSAPNTLTEHEKADGWTLLFDGRTTSGWRGYKQQTMPAGWSVQNGTLTKSTETEDIVTTGEYGDFELDVDWKIGTGGNSGIFYRGTEEYDHVYWSAPEFQLLDDANAPDGKSRLTAAGSDYGLYPSPAGIVKPAGEWNTTRIIVKGAHVEHWLNGKKLLSYELWSPSWSAKVKTSKFAPYANYGMAKKGLIGIQGDHPGLLALRNIKLKALH
ncbi:MAG TPA: DUF1080 domain-containing protein [Gemmatimonadaceae bacterium]|nr:DUF1080 domain-containing protein [Gemmatimonadaceae bacterium]